MRRRFMRESFDDDYDVVVYYGRKKIYEGDIIRPFCEAVYEECKQNRGMLKDMCQYLWEYLFYDYEGIDDFTSEEELISGATSNDKVLWRLVGDFADLCIAEQNEGDLEDFYVNSGSIEVFPARDTVGESYRRKRPISRRNFRENRRRYRR